MLKMLHKFAKLKGSSLWKFFLFRLFEHFRSSVLQLFPQSVIRSSICLLSRASGHPVIQFGFSVEHPVIRSSAYGHPVIQLPSQSVIRSSLRASGHPVIFSVGHPVIQSSNLASQSSIRSSDLASPTPISVVIFWLSL